MSFSGTTAGATAECVEIVSASAEGVSASAGAVCNLTGAVTASVEAICSFRWSYFSFCRSYCSFRWSRF